MLQFIMTDLIHLAKLEREGFALRQRFQRESIQQPLTSSPAATCCQCQQPHQPRQHRVVRTLLTHKALIKSTSRWPRPLPDDVIELAFANGWFYVSLNVPLQQVFQSIQSGDLPWLCPHCAGYQSHSNLFAPTASILTDNGEIRYVPTFVGHYLSQAEPSQKPNTI